MSELKYNWGWIAIGILALVVIVSISKCKKDVSIPESPTEYIDSLIIENNILKRAAKEIEAKRISDSIELVKEIEYYKSLKRKERIIYVGGKVGGTLVDKDTLTCFSDAQLDSVGVISIERDFCYEDRESLMKLNSIKDIHIGNTDKALAKSIDYSKALEVSSKLIRQDRDKQVEKKVRNRKIAIGLAVVSITEGVLLLLK